MRAPEEIEPLRKRAAARRSADPLGAALLDLAASLLGAVGPDAAAPWYRRADAAGAAPVRQEARAALESWVAVAAELLGALGGTLTAGPPTMVAAMDAASVVSTAGRLASLSRGAGEAVSKAAAELRQESIELVRRVTEIGPLERREQEERARLHEEQERHARLEQSIARLGDDKARIADKVAALQERMRLAAATLSERQALQVRVQDEETRADAERKTIQELEARVAVLEEERRELGARIARTRGLVEELERSGARELLRRVQDVWRLLPADGEAVRRP